MYRGLNLLNGTIVLGYFSFFSFASLVFTLLVNAGSLNLFFFTAGHYFCFSTGTSKPLPALEMKSC